MVTTRKNNFERFQVGVLNPELVPTQMDVVIGDRCFELKFIKETPLPAEQPQSMDVRDGKRMVLMVIRISPRNTESIMTVMGKELQVLGSPPVHPILVFKVVVPAINFWRMMPLIWMTLRERLTLVTSKDCHR